MGSEPHLDRELEGNREKKIQRVIPFADAQSYEMTLKKDQTTPGRKGEKRKRADTLFPPGKSN